jgi:hypothetical protein
MYGLGGASSSPNPADAPPGAPGSGSASHLVATSAAGVRMALVADARPVELNPRHHQSVPLAGGVGQDYHARPPAPDCCWFRRGVSASWPVSGRLRRDSLPECSVAHLLGSVCRTRNLCAADWPNTLSCSAKDSPRRSWLPPPYASAARAAAPRAATCFYTGASAHEPIQRLLAKQLRLWNARRHPPNIRKDFE